MSEDTARFPVQPLLDVVVIDCPDPVVLAEFYGTILGWSVEDGSDDDWVTLEPPGGGLKRGRPGGGTGLAFQRIDDFVAPTWPGGAHPQQYHLDFVVPVIADAEPAVLAAGARMADEQPSEDGGFTVYLDPAGHPFCLCRGTSS